MITQNEVVLKHILTVADPFTKLIARDAFARHVRSLGAYVGCDKIVYFIQTTSNPLLIK